MRKISLWIMMMGLVLGKIENSAGIDVTVNPSQKYQTIEGFGGGLMYGVWPYGRKCKDELYDSIFRVARCNIVRIKNEYDPQADTTDSTYKEVTEIPMMKEIQQKYPDVKITIASWSPPKYLKQGDTIAGIVDGKKQSLKKENGEYVYEKYADYWYKSIKHFLDAGIKLHWISIQNEPDWPAEWDGCLFLPQETSEAASYGKALDAVYNKVKNFGIPLIGPDMTGPEGIGGNDIFKYLSNIDISKLGGISHHFYNGAKVDYMRNIKQRYSSKPRYQTEYLINDGKEWQGKVVCWFDHLQLINDALVEEEVSMYLLFALAYKKASTHCFFSLDSLDSAVYTTRPIYYGFKHFSRSIHRGWKRVAASASNLKVSAFSNNSNDSMCVIIINTGSTSTSATIKGIPDIIDSAEAFQTSKESGGSDKYGIIKKYEKIGSFSKSKISNLTVNLDPYSITTVDFWKKNPTIIIKDNIILSKELSLKVEKRNNVLFVYLNNIHTIPDNVKITLFDICGREIKTFTTRRNGNIITFSGRDDISNRSYLLKISISKDTYILKQIFVN